MAKFLRRTWNRYLKLGKKRKKKQVWRKPKGRDNKMREKRKGYPAIVSVGYKKGKKKSAIIVKNLKDLEKIKKEDVIIIGKIGKKKKIEIVKKANELRIGFCNLDVKKFLKDLEKTKIKKEVKKAEKKDTKSKIKNKEKEK